jgi:hypothetical protein
MPIGWMKLYRKFILWEWYKDSKMVHLFIHFLLKANHRDEKWKGIIIKRGQFVTSLKNLSIETGISVRSVRTFIKRLKSTHDLTCETTSSYSIITLINWESYQGDSLVTTRKTTHEVTGERHANDTQTTLNKNIKNDKNIKKKEYSQNSEEFRLSKLLFEKIKERDQKHKQPSYQKWSEEIEKLYRIDGRSYADIEKVICWCQQNDFWKDNILSAKKLRKQFGKLWLETQKHIDDDLKKYLR